MANHIEAFFHCTQCMQEKPDGVSPREWVRLEVGWTRLGLQVWCIRHDANVVHIDFEGVQHIADTTASGDFGGVAPPPHPH